MSKQSANSKVKSVDNEESNNNENVQSAVGDLLPLNIEQIRKIQVLEKEIEFWQNKCVDLKVELNNQRVQANKDSDEKEDKSRQTINKQQSLESQVTKLQKDLENAQHQNKSLKMQLGDKEKQIQTFEKQTQSHQKELNELKEKMKQVKQENQAQKGEKESLEAQLAEAKKENSDLKSKSTDATSSPQTPEQFIEALGEEKDLQEMQRFSLMVQSKFMHMYSQQWMENLSSNKGAVNNPAGATPNGFQMPFPPNAGPGMMNGFNQQQFGMAGMMPAGMQMNGGAGAAGGMPQMPNQMFGNLGQYPPHMNPNANGMIMNNHQNQGTF